MIFTEQTTQACQLHYDAMLQYEDEQVMFEKVQFVRDGQMRPEELGMT